MAHRGNKVAFPENTMSAFRQALQDGADLIETDLHLSADDVFMCIHDGTIDRTTDGSGAVAEMSLSELKKFNAAAARPELPPEPIPTLRDLAEILPADIGLALELKTDRFLEPATCRRLAQELEQLGLKARTVVLSFSLTRLDTLRLVAPDLPVGWITLSKIWPIWGVEMIGPFWPLLFLNPFYVYLAHSRQQIICPLDPKPDSRLWYYRFLRCDAFLTDNPAGNVPVAGKVAWAATPGRLVSGSRSTVFTLPYGKLSAERGGLNDRRQFQIPAAFDRHVLPYDQAGTGNADPLDTTRSPTK